MATVELTFEQVLDAVRQLPADERVTLLHCVLETTAADADEGLERLRARYEMPPQQQRRMSVLAEKSRSRTITPREREELDRLVDDFKNRALAMAREAAGQSRMKGG